MREPLQVMLTSQVYILIVNLVSRAFQLIRRTRASHGIISRRDPLARASHEEFSNICHLMFSQHQSILGVDQRNVYVLSV